MENKEQLLDHYYNLIRKGFPRGEVKAELIAKGFTDEEAEEFLIDLYRISSDKSNNREFDFYMIITAIFFFYGIHLLVNKHSDIGYGFLFMVACKFLYDFVLGIRKRD